MSFSFKRLYALLRKETIQVTRDALTLRFIIAVPIMQLFLFGYAINSNPHNLPTGLLSVEHSKYERTVIAALRNSGYYDIRMLASEAEAERALAQGELMFVIAFPPNFDRSVDRGDRPSVLIDADATDPSAIGNATAALATVASAAVALPMALGSVASASIRTEGVSPRSTARSKSGGNSMTNIISPCASTRSASASEANMRTS